MAGSTNQQLHDAVTALIRRQVKEVEYLPGRSYKVHAPCLLAQLDDAVRVGSEHGNQHGVPGSRALIDPQAWDLQVEIHTTIHMWADHLGINRSNYLGQPSRAGATPLHGLLLRAVAATALTQGKAPIIEAVIRNTGRWATRISNLLDGTQEVRGIRGATCPSCGASSTTEQRPDGGYVVPAIAVSYSAERWPYQWCRHQVGGEACGWWEWLHHGDTQTAEAS